MSAAESLVGTAGGFCQGGRGHGWHHSMALPMVGGNERLMERPGGADLSAIAGGCWAWGVTAGSTPSHRLWSGGSVRSW